jgi:hypothetical protein
VGSFDTLGTGFIVAQLGLQDEHRRPKDTIIYANCAPRRDLSNARHDNEGERFSYGVLSNGVPILVVNAGHSLSFVRDEFKELWTVKVDRGGSQFRSRDNFPPIVGKVAHGVIDFKGEAIDPATIPAPPDGVIAYIDSFGNLKTTYRQGSPELARLTAGQKLRLTIGSITRTAMVSDGSFNVQEGEIAFAPGSSGHQRRFWEIFKRGGSAWGDFGNPPVGSRIVLGSSLAPAAVMRS